MKTGSFTGGYLDVLHIITEYDVIFEVKAGIPIVIPKEESGYNMCLLKLIECSNVFRLPERIYESYTYADISKLRSAYKYKRIRNVKKK